MYHLLAAHTVPRAGYRSRPPFRSADRLARLHRRVGPAPTLPHAFTSHDSPCCPSSHFHSCPVVFHEFEGAKAIPYDVPGTDAGNSYKIKKLLSAYDEDAKKAVDLLIEHPNCTGRIGATGMCEFGWFGLCETWADEDALLIGLGGHLAFRVSSQCPSVPLVCLADPICVAERPRPSCSGLSLLLPHW